MIHSYTSRAVIIGFLSFLKNNYQLKKKKKNFYFKMNLAAEIKLFYIDSRNDRILDLKQNCFFKKILKNTNFLILQKLGSGFNSSLIFGILFYIWNKKKKKLCLIRKEKALILSDSKEDRLQLATSLSNLLGIYSFDLNQENHNFSIGILSGRFFQNLSEKPLNCFPDVILFKGENFLSDYHKSIIKIKNISSIKRQTIKRILVFYHKITIKNLVNKKNLGKLSLPTNGLSKLNFNCNTILDISSSQFTKIRRLIKVAINYRCTKIIRSCSWERCLVLCELMIKSLKKLNFACKNVEIVKVAKFSYLILNFGNYIQYHAPFIFKTKTGEKKSLTIFHDVDKKQEIYNPSLHFSKIVKTFHLNIYFLLRIESELFLKLLKSHYYKSLIFYF